MPAHYMHIPAVHILAASPSLIEAGQPFQASLFAPSKAKETKGSSKERNWKHGILLALTDQVTKGRIRQHCPALFARRQCRHGSSLLICRIGSQRRPRSSVLVF